MLPRSEARSSVTSAVFTRRRALTSRRVKGLSQRATARVEPLHVAAQQL